jgi:hypothetical protein
VFRIAGREVEVVEQKDDRLAEIIGSPIHRFIMLTMRFMWGL